MPVMSNGNKREVKGIIMPSILQIRDLWVRYSGLPVIQGVSFEINKGETVCILGSNGAGKSTILRSIMGAQRAYQGEILFEGQDIRMLPTEEIVRLGITYVPEEKMLFGPMTVEENLLIGAYIVEDEAKVKENIEYVYHLFPRLRERKTQLANTLSGGEQQMVAIGRGLMCNPKVLMLDEPSLGLAPVLVDEVLDIVKRLKEEKMTILLVEQNVRETLEISDMGYVIQTGRVVTKGDAQTLLKSEEVRKAFLGL